ncbi:uncharacterized protein G2W53_039952 [Senna tora]|uniref:Uncharacterized protein n=1 Tax=Senna tora TaxID=362788 RepID=A0A834SQT7_9FABA|nr:uncharacterized protein G2W53_039952 [Senna tora]
MTQGSLPRSFKAIRVGRPVVDHVDRRPPKMNHPWVNFFSRQNLTCICGVKMIPMTQGSLPRSFKAIPVGRPVVDHVDSRPSKINESWPMTQGNLPRSFKAIRLERGQIFDGRPLGSSSVAVHPT